MSETINNNKSSKLPGVELETFLATLAPVGAAIGVDLIEADLTLDGGETLRVGVMEERPALEDVTLRAGLTLLRAHLGSCCSLSWNSAYRQTRERRVRREKTPFLGSHWK